MSCSEKSEGEVVPWKPLESEGEVVPWKPLESEREVVPWKPLESDCCGSGCNPCILDIYEQELEMSKKKLAITLTSSHLNTANYTEFELVEISKHIDDVNIYRFKLEENEKLGHKPGQHVIIRQNHPTVPGSSITRQYSILSLPDETGYFNLLIKLYPTGQMSYVIRNWKVGEIIPMRGPYGILHSENLSNHKSILFICQGTGLVPFLSVINHLLSDEQSDLRIHLIFCIKTNSDILQANHIYEFCNYWNFYLTIYISSPVLERFKLFGPNKILKNTKLTKSAIEKEICENRKYILCGSKDFMTCIKTYLSELQVDKGAIFRL